MGEHDVNRERDVRASHAFVQRLVADVSALEAMLEAGQLERDGRRIGAEQELFLVDRAFQPAPVGQEVLEAVGDPHLTTELARFNLELNLDPIDIGPRCLEVLEQELERLLAKVRVGAESVGARVVLTGILPTLDISHLSLDNMAPVPRYAALNEAARQLRGRDFALHVKGRDELRLHHDNVMLEACNTSFQLHLQVDPSTFAQFYNIAQAIAAPTLAAATYSPLLFGRRLWHETRIALFQQSIDTRHLDGPRRTERPRVSFGERWVDSSVLEIFREDISRFRLLLCGETGEDPNALLRAGKIPSLSALRLHNGTVYRWNRPCYGISEGKPHLRIENRILPSGPSIVDQVANAAFWLGLMKAVAEEVGDVTRGFAFGTAKENFLAAARRGLGAQLTWIDGRSRTAPDLIRSTLLPQAAAGLRALGIDDDVGERYLGIIDQRVRSGQTGSQWLLDSAAAMRGQGSERERVVHVTAAAIARQEAGEPVHAWPLAGWRERAGWQGHCSEVRSLMTTDLFTVGADEVLDLAASIMDWQHIRHVPVEDEQHHLVGLLTHRTLLRALARCHGRATAPIPVSTVMKRELHTVRPDTPTLDAMALMREHRVACLPVVEDGRLVGMLTERDFIKVSSQLLERFLRGTEPDADPAPDEREPASPRR